MDKRCRIITSVAGAGKTHRVTETINEWLESGIAPEEICAVSFTITAAEELRSRISTPGVVLSTVHSLAYQVCREKGMIPPFGYDFYDQLLLTASIIFRTSRPRFRAIAVDEAQDITETQRLFLTPIMLSAEEVLIVGDPNQSIYGFLGVAPDVIYTMARGLDHKVETECITESHRFGIPIATFLSTVFERQITSKLPSAQTMIAPKSICLKTKNNDEGTMDASQMVEILGRTIAPGETGAILSYTNRWREDFLGACVPGSVEWSASFARHPYGSYSQWVMSCLDSDYRLSNNVDSRSKYWATFMAPMVLPGIATRLRQYLTKSASINLSAKSAFLPDSVDVIPKELRSVVAQLGDHLMYMSDRLRREAAGQSLTADEMARILYDGAEEMIPYIGYWKDSSETIEACIAQELSTGSAIWTMPGALPINLSTVHGAKGREYDHVMVILTDGILWAGHENLLYVACTRARKTLTFVHPYHAAIWHSKEGGMKDIADRLSEYLG